VRGLCTARHYCGARSIHEPGGGIARRYGWSLTAVRLTTAVVAIAIPGISVVPTLLIYFLLGYLLLETDEF
jgi:phage shock protein PspC (stress-responsive transcriptional regulator)